MRNYAQLADRFRRKQGRKRPLSAYFFYVQIAKDCYFVCVQKNVRIGFCRTVWLGVSYTSIDVIDPAKIYSLITKNGHSKIRKVDPNSVWNCLI